MNSAKSDRSDIAASRRWVVKIGSSLLTADGRGLDLAHMDGWAAQIAALKQSGKEVVVVSSGAVAEGMARLGWSKRPQDLHQLQAAAAVGQMGLIQAWESRLREQGLKTAQVLLTHEDVRDRQRYLNARSALLALLKLGVVPVVNENDTVATDEIRLGDNDTLAALTLNLVEGELLVLLTDQQGLFDADPRQNADARLIAEAQAGDEKLMELAGGGMGALGRGGMRTKLTAAAWAARSGAATIIGYGRDAAVLKRIAAGENVGTLLRPQGQRLAARKRWIAGQSKAKGKLILDAGAVRALREGGKSLLPVGVKAIEGDFQRGDLVACVTAEGSEIAQGLTNYSASEARQTVGKSSAAVKELLGPLSEPELIHRDNLVIG